MDLYESFQDSQNRRASKEASRKADKLERGKSISDWMDSITTGSSTKKYREGWDRIFGKERRDDISGEGDSGS